MNADGESGDRTAEPNERPLDVAGSMQSVESRRGDVAGAPTWPIVAAEAPAQGGAPVGLNWQFVAQALDVDVRVLRHDGLIIVAGDYFPSPGYFFDPQSLDARVVDVGDIALITGYFIGSATLREFTISLPSGQDGRSQLRCVIPSPGSGQVIGIFVERLDANRAMRRIIRGALGAGVVIEEGPLGFELRVKRPHEAGRVASVMASHGGGVIAIDGSPVMTGPSSGGISATSHGGMRYPGDARRAGTGVTGGSSGPEISSSTQILDRVMHTSQREV